MPINYTAEVETLLKQESEKSEAMSLLHIFSHRKYHSYSIAINVPVIILSSLIGFLSTIDLRFAQQPIILGALSIFTGIIKTADSYFDYTKRCESHRLISLSYKRISKLIQLQLALERDHRISASDLLDIVRNDLQNLADAEPMIDQDVIAFFNKKYKDEPTTKPSITNGLTQVKVVVPRPDAIVEPPTKATEKPKWKS